MTTRPSAVSSDDAIRTLLLSARTIAVVGASPKPWRDSHGIMRLLLDAGYDVHPVNPHYTEVLGRPCVPDLAAIPVPIDIVDVFRNPGAARAVVDEALGVHARAVWFQLGASDDAAVRYALDAGLTVVAERCIAVDLRRLLPRGARA